MEVPAKRVARHLHTSSPLQFSRAKARAHTLYRERLFITIAAVVTTQVRRVQRRRQAIDYPSGSHER